MTIFKVTVPMGDVQAPTSTGFDPLPVGEYQCEILEADVKQTATQGRSQLALVLRVADGEFANRRIFDRRNIPIEGEGPDNFLTQKFREALDAVPGCFDFETGNLITENMVGATVMVKTRNEADKRPGYEGNVQTRVAKIYTPQDPEAVQAEAPAAPAAAPKPAPAPAVKPKAAAPKPAAPKATHAVAAPAATAPVARSPFRRPAGAA